MTTLLVCSAGGHLKQLHRLVPRLGLDDDLLWYTFDTGLSRSLLEGQNLHLARFAGPRDLVPLARNAATLRQLIIEQGVDRAVSTGSGLAVSAFAALRARGGQCHYIETAARAEGPSMTGKICERIPGIHLYTQYMTWDRPHWNYRGSVFDGFSSGPNVGSDGNIFRVVVSLGTSETHGFRRLVARLKEILPKEAEILWQTGSTDVSGLGVDARVKVPAAELKAAISEADVVISHAGTGSALTAWECGKFPLLVPRRLALKEHIDDHQVQIARELHHRGLAHTVDASKLSLADLEFTMTRSIIQQEEPAFALER